MLNAASARPTILWLPGMIAGGPKVDKPGLCIDLHDHGDDAAVVRLVGELDLASADELRECLAALAGRGRDVVVDLAELTFIDAGGLGVLARARVVAEAKRCTITLRRPTPGVARVLAITRLDDVFTIIGTSERAAPDADRRASPR